jgi:protein ImuB
MDRTACVDVPALPLQLLLRREPSFVGAPVVVVADDRPQAEVLWADALAQRSRIRPGMSYAAAQSLDARVRAGVVPPEEIEEAIDRVARRLSTFSPRVEAFGGGPFSVGRLRRPKAPSDGTVEGAPGVFWLDPSGMIPLFTSFEHWGHGIREALEGIGLRSNVVVGFHRFRCYALCRVRHGVWVLEDAGQEAKAAGAVPLRHLAVPAKLRDGLERLEVRTVGQLLRLPAADLRARFGEAAAQLHARASDGFTPLVPRVLVEPVRAEKSVEPPDDDRTRLLFLLKSMLHDLMVELAERGQAMSALRLRLCLDHRAPHDERLEPARPTLDEPMVVDLVRLRLDAATLPAAVEAIELELEGVEAPPGQLALFRTQARRDLDAAARALSRVRAWLGPEAVTRARLRPAHLPEARFEWEPIAEIGFARPEVVGTPAGAATTTVTAAPGCTPLPLEGRARPRDEPVSRLQRRLLPRPQRLPAPPRPPVPDDPDAPCPLRLPAHHGAITAMEGPFRKSGGWWVRTVERDYYFAQTELGQVSWVFYDRVRRSWYLQGWVD